MKVLKEKDTKNYFINTKEIDLKEVSNLNNKQVKDILKLISEKSMYPKEIAKRLKVHEQNIYYHIKKLEKSGIIVVDKQENINGTIASFYKVASDSFFFKFNEFKESSKIYERQSSFLSPFVEKSRLNSLIIVGSPDPHGPQKARSRDGYFGMDLALFLGSFVSYVEDSKVRLDTEVTDEELRNNNLIVIGGPIVNRVTGLVNKKMPIYFDEEKKGIYSKISKKTYFNDEIGFVNKFKSPFNDEKKILLVAGIRNSGTKAAIVSFLKHFDEVKKGNMHDSKKMCRVVEGVDLDSDGKVDDCEFLE